MFFENHPDFFLALIGDVSLCSLGRSRSDESMTAGVRPAEVGRDLDS
jgi:hypothetical protein